MSLHAKLAPLPRAFDPGLFGELTRRAIQFAEETPGIRSLWTYGGNNGIPWLSDIDLLYVVDTDEFAINQLANDRVFDPSLSRLVFRTESLVVDETCLSRQRYYFGEGIIRYRLLAGMGEQPTLLTDTQAKAVVGAIVGDTYPRNLAALASLMRRPSIDCADMFRMLGHICMSIRGILAHYAGDLQPSTRLLAEEFHDRGHQLKHGAHGSTLGELADGLARQLDRALQLYGPVMRVLESVFRASGVGALPPGHIHMMSSIHTAYIACSPSRLGGLSLQTLDELNPIEGHPNLAVIPVPHAFFTLLSNYCACYPDPSFGEFSRARIVGDFPVRAGTTPFAQAICERARLGYDHVSMLAKSGASFGLEPDLTGFLWAYRHQTLQRNHDARLTQLCTQAILTSLEED